MADQDGVKSSGTSRKEDTKQHIISVALALFKRQGIEATTMEQIAQEADMSKSTLYKHFPVKEAIISEHILLAIRLVTPARKREMRRLADTRSRLIYALHVFMAAIEEQPDLFERFLLYEVGHMISIRPDMGSRQGIPQIAREIVRRGVKDGEIRADIPLPTLIALFQLLLVEIAREFYSDREKFDASRIITTSVDLFMNGARTR